jgi:sugar lactone lactonase YvrE
MPEVNTLLSGLVVGESPRWHANRLWFSNWGAQEIIVVDLDGNSQVMVHVPTKIPFSIDWLPDGRLLVVSGRENLILSKEQDGSLVTYADLRNLSGKGWNEIVVDGRGNVYVNGGGFDLMSGEAFAPGIIALVSPDRSIRQVADGIAFPNGMAVTPDNATLIIAESYAGKLTAFDIQADGSLSNRRTWASVPGSAPDGICIDAEGAVWYADVPNKRCVRVREGGQVIQTVDLDRGCFACMLGGENRQTLFMLAAEWNGPSKMFDQPHSGQVLTIKAPAPGAGWP